MSKYLMKSIKNTKIFTDENLSITISEEENLFCENDRCRRCIYCSGRSSNFFMFSLLYKNKYNKQNKKKLDEHIASLYEKEFHFCDEILYSNLCETYDNFA
jgi:regulator of replication initiation timing